MLLLFLGVEQNFVIFSALIPTVRQTEINSKEFVMSHYNNSKLQILKMLTNF